MKFDPAAPAPIMATTKTDVDMACWMLGRLSGQLSIHLNTDEERAELNNASAWIMASLLSLTNIWALDEDRI